MKLFSFDSYWAPDIIISILDAQSRGHYHYNFDTKLLAEFVLRACCFFITGNLPVVRARQKFCFFTASYDFLSFHETFFLLSIVSKIWVCWENGNFRSENWENGNPNYANRKGFQKVTFAYFTSRIQSTCALRLRFSKFIIDLLKAP